MTTPDQKRSSTGSRVPGMTGAVGEPGLPPSRPSSIATAHSGSQTRWSRTEGRRGGGVQSGISVTGSVGAQSRPTTAASRTHVPLAAHGFFRPMSSQRLQQQRNQRPNSLLANGSLYAETTHDAPASSYRQSVGSAQTMRGAPALSLHQEDEHENPPPSRGTDVTDRYMPDRTTANTTPTGAETVRSRDESITPLQRPRPQHLDLSTAHGHDAGKLPTPSKSPRSFRSSFLLSSRDGRSAQMRPNQGHEKLTSAESSPRLTRKEAAKESVKRELGKNHEYFSGNTAFCWGGRLQNTRDRPVNVATAVMIIVPAGLFFGYSCVRPCLCWIAR
jgi:palmitoyltransferase ZDHHC9/14/18